MNRDGRDTVTDLMLIALKNLHCLMHFTLYDISTRIRVFLDLILSGHKIASSATFFEFHFSVPAYFFNTWGQLFKINVNSLLKFQIAILQLLQIHCYTLQRILTFFHQK